MIRALLITTLLFTQYTYSQSVKSDSVITDRLYILGGVSAAAFIYAYGIQNNMWWKGEKSGFHTNWSEDWNASLGADKIGHFYFGFSTATIYKHGFQWSGFSKSKSLLYSGLFSFTYQTFLEIRDGFSKDYGFSWGDFGANLLGSMYPVIQNRFPLLNNFNLKISYQASERFRNNSNRYILDDYESTYHWLSIDINNLLPSSAAKYFPDFINMTVGHSVNGLNNSGKRNHEFYIGLDWDIEALPGSSPVLLFLKEVINLYHLPAPTIKVYPNIIWYGLKF